MGFSNVVRVSFNEKVLKNITMECNVCDTIYPNPEKENEWIIRIDSLKPATIVVKRRKGIFSKEKVLKTQNFSVCEVPNPILFLDTLSAEALLTKIPKKLILKLETSIPLTINFLIKSWEIDVNTKKFKGLGNELSPELKEFLAIEKKGLIVINIQYLSPLGKQEMKEIFEFDVE